MSAAFVLFTMGRSRDALREADRAALLLRGPALDRLRAQRGTIRNRLGQTEEALAEYAAALPGLVRARDRLWEARLRNNRAILYIERNDIGAASRDLMRARQLFQDLDMPYALAQIEHNLGFLAARSGAAVSALDWYARAEAGYRAAGVPTTGISINRAELLLALRLPDEAVAAARGAVAASESARRGSNLAEARLVLAEAALLAGDAAVADEAATEALRSFRRQRRPSWALGARWVRLRARATPTIHSGPPEAVQNGQHSAAATRAGVPIPEPTVHSGPSPVDGLADPAAPRRLLAECRRLADQLAAARWDAAAIDARILAAELASRQRRPQLAGNLLTSAATPGQRRQPALIRARGLYAKALGAHLAGDRPAALRALRRGTGIIAEYATALGSADLRAGVAGHIADLTDLGVRIAAETGRPADRAAAVLRWSELGRGLTLHTRPAAPPDDGELAELLVRLRAVATELRAATVRGDDPRPLLRRQAQLEAEVRELTRRSPGSSATPAAPVQAAELAAMLGAATLVSYTEVGGQLLAVVCAGGQATLHPLGPVRPVGDQIAALLAGLRRLAVGFGPAAALRQRQAIVVKTAARLGGTLLGGLPVPAAGPVVIVPTGPLHSLPWSALPSLADRAVTVVPSGTLWARLRAAPPTPPGRTVVVAGPDLPGAEAEVADVAAAAAGSVRLSGPQATVAGTLAAIDGAEVAHIACHGDFRPGNPLFSTLRLADGPLTAYDLQRLRRVPRLLVLSACDAGRSAVTPGEGLLGLSASLLSLGAAALIAPLVAVPDDTTRALMVELHRHLGDRRPAAEALRLARAALPDSTANYATTASFICLGGG
jgi:tetratricopeptide (TPR) repeat protein